MGSEHDDGAGGAPHQLRLAALLRDLLRKARRRNRRPVATVEAGECLTIGEILDTTAHAGFGFVAAFLALVAIPFVGVSTPFGLAIAFVGAQIAYGRSRPWLPARLRRRPISLHTLDTITRWLTRMTRWMTHLVRARLPAMTSRAGFTLIGIGLVIQGIGLALPVPLPGSNMIFLVPILIYAIGVLDDDGLLIAIAHGTTIINIGCIVLLWRGVEMAIAHGLGWLGL